MSSSTNKRKRRSSGDAGSKKPSDLMVRLSDGCKSHQSKHHNQDDLEDLEEGDEPSQDCFAEMKSLKSVVPFIEKELKLCKQVDPKDIVNLCHFYRSVIECTYCPHSMEIIFDDARRGVEILPRVHHLCCHLSSDAMVLETMNATSRYQMKTNNEANENGGRGAPEVSADQISNTIAVLLNAIPEVDFFFVIFEDLIRIILDLNELYAMGVMDDPNVNTEDIEVVLFSQVHGSLYGQEEEDTEDTYGLFEVQIGSVERLFMLQSSLLQVLFHLMVMMQLSDLRRDLDGHEREALVGCISEIMLTDVPAHNDLSPSGSTNIRATLAIRGKIMTCNMLLLLLAESGSQSSPTSLQINQLELTEIICESVILHMQWNSRYTDDAKMEGALRKMTDILSAMLVTLLRDSYILPLNHKSFESESFCLRTKCTKRLIDSLPRVAMITAPSLEITRLSKMILHAINVSLSPESWCEQTSRPRNVFRQHLDSIFEYCSMRSIFPILFKIVRNEPYTMITNLIISQLWQCLGRSDKKNFALDRAITIASNIEDTNVKRRKRDYSHIDPKQDDDNMNLYINDSSMTMALGSYLSNVVEKITCILSCGDGDKNREEKNSAVLSMILEKGEGTIDVFNALYLLELLISQYPKGSEISKMCKKHFDNFYGAGELVSKAISFWMISRKTESAENGEHKIDTLVKTISKLFLSQVEIDPWPRSTVLNRRNMVKSFAQITIPFCIYLSKNQNNLALEGREEVQHSRSAVSPSYMAGMSIGQRNDLSMHLLRNRVNCKRICHRFARAFGGKLPRSHCDYDCMCARTSISSSIFLLEDLLFPKQLITFLTNVYLCHSCFDDNVKNDIQVEVIYSNLTEEIKRACIASLSFLFSTVKDFNFFEAIFNKVKLLEMLDESSSKANNSNRASIKMKVEGLSRILALRIKLSAVRNEAQVTMRSRDKTNVASAMEQALQLLPLIESDEINLRKCMQAHTQARTEILDIEKLLGVIKRTIEITSKSMISWVEMRKALWILLALAGICCPITSVVKLSEIYIPISENDCENDLDHGIVDSVSDADPTATKIERVNLLAWLLQIPFSDDDRNLRSFSATQIGAILFHDDHKLLKLLLGRDQRQDGVPTTSHIEQVSSRLFDQIDLNLHKYCGVSQSELSFTLKSTLSTSTYTSNTKTNALSASCSRQISAINLISSLCQQDIEPEMKAAVIDKGVVRLVRFWAFSSCFPCDELSPALSKDFHDVASAAFIELLVLRNSDLINLKTIPHFESAFVPGLISEILTRSLHIPSISSEGRGFVSAFDLLVDFIQSFLIKTSSLGEISLVLDETRHALLLTTLNYFDKFLPSVAAGFVIDEDYESLCACTGFRLFLLGELKRPKRKVNDSDVAMEYIVGQGNVQKKRNYAHKKLSPKDLKAQTAQLCISDGKPNVISHIVKSLLLQKEKAPMVFFLKTVIQERASFGTMLKKTEFVVLEGLISDMSVHDEKNWSESDRGWEHYEDLNAFRAMKQGSLWLKHANETSDKMQMNSAPYFSADSTNTSNAETPTVNDAVQEWVKKYFMRLLISTTTRWKRGRIDTKIAAMKNLLVLVRFLYPVESPQYVTQVLVIVDGCMSLKRSTLIQECDLFKLHSLAIKVLSQFVRMLLSHSPHIVGENLCNILVSILPLFDRKIPEESRTLQDAVDLLDTLVDGETGRTLSPYFMDIPLLPNDERLQNVRQSLKRYGVNFDNLLLMSTQLTETQATRNHDQASINSSSSNSVQDNSKGKRKELKKALQKRLFSLQKLLGHENDNVRILCLQHIVNVVSGNRDLFRSLAEDDDSTLHFLTVKLKGNKSVENSLSSADEFLRSVLSRFTVESNPEIRLLLARVLGEIGAINPRCVDNGSETGPCSYSEMGKKWLVENKPWKKAKARVLYELQLVTIHFVAALKAAPTPTDQHKIAFAIQEILKSLDSNASEKNEIDSEDEKKEMSPWLRDNLVKAEVLSVIEPYWTTIYKLTEGCKSKPPPFYAEANSYYTWLAEWGRFMIERSHDNFRSRFRDLFYACRSAIRSEAGLGVLEFLLPVLVLDSLCFGDDVDRQTTVNELRGVLEKVYISSMDKLEVQKSVDCVFAVLKVLQSWAENEIEDSHKSQRGGTSSRGRSSTTSINLCESSDWPAEESVTVIEELQELVPFDLCAKAASNVGMHAQALRYLEMDVRRKEASKLFDGESMGDVPYHEKIVKNAGHIGWNRIDGMEIGLAHRLFGELNDKNAMSAMARCREELSTIDQIRERQSYGDWDGVLRLCELESQTGHNSKQNELVLEGSQIMALIQLGHLDSALNQVTGIIGGISTKNNEACSMHERKGILLPYAAEASWKLGQWGLLDELLQLSVANNLPDKSNVIQGPETDYNLALAKSILALKMNNKAATLEAIQEARESIIPPLSVVASEDYQRAYPYLLKLQCCREIEDAVCHTSLADQYRLNARGSLLDYDVSMDTISIRLTLSRIVACPEQEAFLWLSAGRKARKEGLFHLAENSLSHADAIYQRLNKEIGSEKDSEYISQIRIHTNEVRLQVAKLKHAVGESTEALRMIDCNEFHQLLLRRDAKDGTLTKALTNMQEENTVKSFARNALQATEWIVKSGLKSGSEAIARYEFLNQISPKWERSHFHFAVYLESILDSRIITLAAQKGINADVDDTRSTVIRLDPICQKYLFDAVKQYGEALRFSQKHVFQALPRLLTLWTDFTAIDIDDDNGISNQDGVNKLMSDIYKTIPAVSFYSVLPQLISRIGHSDEDTRTILCVILKRVLVKFPAQALWHLVWLRFSVHKDRRIQGEDIFKGAQKSLSRNESMKMHDLLEASKGLVSFLISLAKHVPKKQTQSNMTIECWEGTNLKDFIPPVQAALTVALHAAGKKGRPEPFPQYIPRIRAFCSVVQVMASKAKPKRLSAFVVAEGSKSIGIRGGKEKKPQPDDIGEMHFLVKTEAKGDLRKDARVQDLNTVINRLFANTAGSGRNVEKQYRSLNLRTFSVVCLSEECGIIEWVPSTNSFRNLVSSCYNPHANRYSARRRGKRGSNFGDVHLRASFMKSQDQYMKLGNLTAAAKMFDELLLKEYPPVFYWFFIHSFSDPHKWFEARTKFALSAAAWSAVGHVIGLGDRHSENILIDTTKGECVHVDFDCIFDKALFLPRPEVVPFRLTPNMVDGFGPTGADGTFSGGLQAAMTTLRDNRDVLLSVLEPFIRDPVIDWKRQRAPKKGAKEDNENKGTIEAKRSIRTIDERLKGMYNLRNPNHKKIKRDRAANEDDEIAKMLPLSIEGQVHKMISEATSHENLVQVYFGWMPWL